MKYSFNRDRDGVVFANTKDVNASYKDLGAVCAAIRYRSVGMALQTLEEVIYDGRAVQFRKHNKHMGHRGELGGRKGRYPKKCAALVKKVLVNAAANARNKGLAPEVMFVVHSSANKTNIIQRGPSKGALFTQSGIYGLQPARSSNIELARIELGIASPDAKGLSEEMRHQIKRFSSIEQMLQGRKGAKKLPEPLRKAGVKLLQKKEAKKEEKNEAKAEQKPAPAADVQKKDEQKADQRGAEAKRETQAPKSKSVPQSKVS
jgi:large subunit ribosomal protein L22